MKLNEKKLKRHSDIGDKLDLGPLIVIVVSLFGIGIFYALFRSGATLAAFALFFFAAALVIALLLYGIGRIFKKSANKMAFNYIDESINAVAGKICSGDIVDMTLNLSVRKNAIIFTLTAGTVKAVCDFSSAKKLPEAATMFIDVCLGVTAKKIKTDIAAGKTYKSAFYQIIVNDSPSPAQFFVKDGILEDVETDRVMRIYKNISKKYKK